MPPPAACNRVSMDVSLHVGITRRSTPKQIDYVLYSQRWRSSIQSAKTRPGADNGSDHELLIAKFRLELKKVGKTTRPFRYDINQIRYSGSEKYIQGIRSDRQSAWRTMDGGLRHCTGGSDQDGPQEKEVQHGKMVVWGGLFVRPPYK